MPGRSYSPESYCFGFNGKENDNEVKGTGTQQDYGMRISDPDPLVITMLVPRGLRYKQ